METPWQPFPIEGRARLKLIRMAEQRESVFPFAENRSLAAALACVGLQAEMGGSLDRLGEAIGLTPTPGAPVLWQSEIIGYQGELGIRLWIDGIEEFQPRESELSGFLHPLSLDADGKLNQLVLFPAQVADAFRARGIELVIVRDWILRSGLVEDRTKAIDYTRSNLWEISQNISHLQAGLLRDRRLAFFGTHDLTDHLMGATREGLDQARPLVLRILDVFRRVFPEGKDPSPYALTLSYLIGLALDDLAQPQWYGSRNHEYFVDRLLAQLEDEATTKVDFPEIFLPVSFNEIVASMRDKTPDYPRRLNAALAALYDEMKRATGAAGNQQRLRGVP